MKPLRAALSAAAFTAAASLLLFGCGLVPETPVRLLTNRPEFAAYVERFNAQQYDVRVEIAYQESPSQAVLAGQLSDVVIGEWLASPAILDRFEALGDMVKPGRVDPAWFYQGLISMGSRDNRPVLVPVSFSLPAIVFYRPSVTTDLPSMFMPLDQLRSMSAAFTATGKNGLVSSVGFSPLWNEEFLNETALLFGARFRPARGGMPAWDPEKLKITVDLVRSWIADASGGPAADSSFSTRYLVPQFWFKLLASRRILFALTPFPDFLALPEEKRRDMDFRWLSQAGAIPVLDNVLFAGVLRSSRNKGGARAFLEWFFTQSVQRSLLEVNQSLRIGVFGITNGFSSLKSVNEKEIAQKYPLLLGHIPSEGMLVFPETLPDNWLKVRDEVIRPWIKLTAAGEEDQLLEKKLDEWLKALKK